jgi:hypothetical protein
VGDPSIRQVASIRAASLVESGTNAMLVHGVPECQPEGRVGEAHLSEAQDVADLLGLPLAHEDDPALVIDAGGTPLRLALVDAVPIPSGPNVGWLVDDVGAPARADASESPTSASGPWTSGKIGRTRLEPRVNLSQGRHERRRHLAAATVVLFPPRRRRR